MPFKLNEAPNIVFATLKTYKGSRKYNENCAIACCLCTCCYSVGFCFCIPDWDEEHDGCYPSSIDEQSKGYIRALFDSLKFIKYYEKKDTPSEIKIQMESPENIEEQVYNTIVLLRDIIKKPELHPGYKRILKETLDNIESRAKTEEEFFKKINLRIITGYDQRLPPNYGLIEIKK